MVKAATITPSGLPAWSREAAIGDYDGDGNKEDSVTEAEEPYAAQWYRELHAMRGSAYTTAPLTLVDAENLAIARHSAAIWSRTPEKVRANATPARADEKLEYWVEVLRIPTHVDDQRWQIRQHCVAQYRAAKGPTLQVVTDALADLLGSAFVQLHIQTGVDLANPPGITRWPGIDPGPASYSLGGGAWFTERNHLFVETTIPPGMNVGYFLNLMNVQMFQMLDTLLPAWATWDWSTSAIIAGNGFLLDISQMDFDGLIP